MNTDIEKLSYRWITSLPDNADVKSESYCQTRDVYQARFDRMVKELFRNTKLKQENAYIITAVAGEIGNNAFDHNIGNWPDIPGIFFGYDISDDTLRITIADRGQGILKTLGKVKPELKTDSEALRVAFTERISGRAPESRGNGLKFVRESIESKKMHLSFISGRAKAELNEKMLIEDTDENVRGCLAIIKM
jgi:hypothetical protein